MQVIKISVVEEHPLLLKDLVRFLDAKRTMTVVGAYQSHDDLVYGLDHQLPDILITDVPVGGSAGIQTIQQLKARYKELRIIVMTNLDHEAYINTLLNIGIHGYLLRDSGKPILVPAIRAVFRGNRFLDSTVSQIAATAQRRRTKRYWK